jgi:hypothetical protein
MVIASMNAGDGLVPIAETVIKSLVTGVAWTAGGVGVGAGVAELEAKIKLHPEVYRDADRDMSGHFWLGLFGGAGGSLLGVGNGLKKMVTGEVLDGALTVTGSLILPTAFYMWIKRTDEMQDRVNETGSFAAAMRPELERPN